MINLLKKENMGKADHGWLKSNFHFSFAEYRNPKNIKFGVLRVLNDDLIKAQSGFDTHPHENMEIITYVISGKLSHKDSLGNIELVKRGQVQYMSAGDGISHSERNNEKEEDLKLLQLWILPPQNGLEKLYGQKNYTFEQRENKLLNIVSSKNGSSDIKIHQDINIYVSEMQKDKVLDFEIKNKRQVYFVQIEGSSSINNKKINQGDAMEITQENSIKIKALSVSHFLFIEMKES